MSEFAKVKDHKGLIRDMYSKAILNVDKETLIEHRRKKSIMKDVVYNSNKIKEIENDMKEIKEMLLQLTKNKV